MDLECCILELGKVYNTITNGTREMEDLKTY
jgi:hypothetical protein